MSVLPAETRTGDAGGEVIPLRLVLLLASISLIILVNAIKVISSVCFTPLRHIPGPWHAKFTQLVLKYHTTTGRRMYYIDALHQRYGPAVRIAPDEVDFCSQDSFREIHRIGGDFLKSAWYSTFRSASVDDVFALRDPKEHARRRKYYARQFSHASLRQNWEGVVKTKAAKAVAQMKAEAKREGSADIYKWWRLMASDIICQLSFGDDFQLVANGKLNTALHLLDLATQSGAFRAESPLLFDALQSLHLPIPFLRKYLDASPALQAYSHGVAVPNARAAGLRTSNIFAAILAEHEKDPQHGAISDALIAAEATGLIAAGSGTTAVTLTYLVHAVLARPQLQAALEAEVCGELLAPAPSGGGDDAGFGDQELERLPLLNAVIDETLRLHGAAPGSLPRTVPEGGAVLCGYALPAGATVGTQAYSLNRDARVFPEPLEFDPYRFLGDREAADRQRAAMCPFGGGTRICLGLHLARMELRRAAALFFRECRGARLAPGVTEEGMRMVHFFLVHPAAGEMRVVLKE